MFNILKNLKFNNYNYYENISLKLNNFYKKNFRGSIIEIQYILPEFYRVNKLKKSKTKKQISFGKLRIIKFIGRCIAKKKSLYNISNNFIIRNVIQKIPIEILLYGASFFLHNITIKVKKEIRKSKLYYLRKKPKKYSIIKFKYK